MHPGLSLVGTDYGQLPEPRSSHEVLLAGGMERPGDDYKRTNNMRLENRDKLFGGQVSRLQVAELVAAAVSNPDLAENKVGTLCSLLQSTGSLEAASFLF